MRRIALLFLVTPLVLAACSNATPAAPGGRLKVVATHSILGDLVHNVGGDQIDLTTLVAAGGDAHTFEPAPADGVTLAQADVVFENGLAFEPWLDDLFASAGATAARVVVTAHLQPRAAPEADGELDPHVWHDVSNASRMVEAVRDALTQADPANAATYQANAEAYLKQLDELDAWVFEQVAKLPEGRRKLVTTHDTFGYFAARYGFEVVGTALGALSTEAADPPAGQIAELVEAIKATGVPAIFAENVSNPKLMEQIAAEAGVQLGPTLYTDALGPPGSPAETYLQLIRYNVETIVTALGQ